MDFSGGRTFAMAAATVACLLVADPCSAFIAPAVVTSRVAANGASATRTPTMVAASPAKALVTTKSDETFAEAKVRLIVAHVSTNVCRSYSGTRSTWRYQRVDVERDKKAHTTHTCSTCDSPKAWSVRATMPPRRAIEPGSVSSRCAAKAPPALLQLVAVLKSSPS